MMGRVHQVRDQPADHTSERGLLILGSVLIEQINDDSYQVRYDVGPDRQERRTHRRLQRRVIARVLANDEDTHDSNP